MNKEIFEKTEHQPEKDESFDLPDCMNQHLSKRKLEDIISCMKCNDIDCNGCVLHKSVDLLN